MATEIDKILIRLDASTAGLREEMRKAQRQTQQSTRRMERSLKSLNREMTGVGLAAGTLFGAFEAIAFGAVGGGFLSIARDSERLRASLETVTGSAQNAQAAFEQIEAFATRTPFTLNEVAESFIQLAALGIKPTEELLESLGNTASALGKPLRQAVEALADATTNEFERLKEFGIKARQEGDKVAFTFRGVTTVVEKEAQAITEFLQGIGETDFAGALERQADTLDGALSNLSGAVRVLVDQFAQESGLIDVIKQAARSMTDLITETKNTELVVTRFAKGIGIALGEIIEGPASLRGRRVQRIEELQERIKDLQEDLDGAFSFLLTDDAVTQRKTAIERLTEQVEVLKASLDDPQFNQLNFEQLQKRLPAAAAAVDDPFAGIGGGGASGATRRPGSAARASSRRNREADRFKQDLNSLIRQLDPAQAKTEAYAESVALLDRAWVEGQISGERYEELVMALATDTEALRLEEERLVAQRERANELIRELDPSAGLDRQIAEVKELSAQFPELAEGLGKVEAQLMTNKESLSEFNQLASEVAGNIQEALGDGLFDVLQGNFEDIGDSFVNMIQRMLAESAAANISQALFGNFGSTGVVGGPGGSFLQTAFGTLFGGGRRGGGSVRPGQMFAVGESGPELFVPTMTGTIIPRGTEAMSSKNVTVVNKIIVPEDTPYMRRSADQIARRVSQRVQTVTR